ncbi:MAG: hypothetical protein V2J65_33325 [Desulfobacteraceae bacterium]|nr:hypothetical protein [Desulfobacteraceae bacterium]
MDENIVLIFPGLIFLVAGLGFLFARTDKSEKERDEKRFGPLSPFNIGGWYSLAQNKIAKSIFIAFCILIGFFFIAFSIISIFK